MSGLEIAGVVLGALPLLICAIENYEKGLNSSKAFWKWEDKLKEATRELWFQCTTYEQSLRLLLGPITSNVELEEMLVDFENDLWKSEDILHELQKRLGVAYKAYMFTIKEIKEITEDLATKLDINKGTKTTASLLENVLSANKPTSPPGQSPLRFEFKKRVKFTMKRKEVFSMIEKVRKCNQRLDSFSEKAGKLEESEHKPRKQLSRLSMPLNRVKEYAISLHRVLSRAWGCSADHSHDTTLLLEHRMTPYGNQKRRSTKEEPVKFIMSFCNPRKPKSWHKADVEVLEENGIAQAQHTPVRFAPTSGNIPGNPQREIISDLCYRVANHQPMSLFCFCLDIKGTLHLNPPQTHTNCYSLVEKTVSLEQVLQSYSQSQTQRWQSITKEDRYILAIVLSSSFLQLDKTPWLNQSWSTKDILFFESKQGDQCRLDVRSPFVMQSYHQAAIDAHGAANTSGNNPSRTIYTDASPNSRNHEDSKNLLALARILLEVHFTNTIESIRQPGDLGPNAVHNEASDLQTLKRWIASEQGNLSLAFRDAVEYCMKCFVDSDANLEDTKFMQGILDNVVAPLIEELYYWQNGFS